MFIRAQKNVKWRARITVGVALSLLALQLINLAQTAKAAPYQLQLSFSGTNGVGRSLEPSLECADGGSASFRQIGEAPIVPGQLGKLSGDFRLNVDFHSSGPPKGFLFGETSHATFTNQRGTLQLLLNVGDCSNQTASFNGSSGSGSGTWQVNPDYTTGGFRQATGSGTLSLTTDLGNGANNVWSIDLDGQVTVLQPSVAVEMIRSTWRHFGVDYAGRIATVDFKITNAGPGDAYDVALSDVVAPTGITPVFEKDQPLGELLAGQSRVVRVRYKIGHGPGLQGPALLGRSFDSTVLVAMGDVLDVMTVNSKTVLVTTPAFPPPL